MPGPQGNPEVEALRAEYVEVDPLDSLFSLAYVLTKGKPADAEPVWRMPYTEAVRWYVTLHEMSRAE